MSRSSEWGLNGYSVFAFVLAVYLPLAVIVPGAITNLAAPMLLLGVVFGWRGWRGLSGETWILVGGFALFFLGGVISLVNNQNWDFAAWRFEKYYPFLLLPLVFSFLGQDPVEDRQVRILFHAALAASFSLAVFALFQPESESPWGVGLGDNLNPNRFGNYACWLAILVAAAALTRRGIIAFYPLLAGAFVAGCYAGLASDSRGSMLALICALGALFVIWLIKSFTWKKVWGGLGGSVLLLSTLAVAVSVDDDWGADLEGAVVDSVHFLEGKPKNNAVGIRLMMWSGAVEIWREHPWVGTGLGDPQDDLAVWIEESGSILEKAFARFHSIYFDALAATGSIGFLTMLLGVFLLPLWYFLSAYYRAQTSNWSEFAALAGAGTIVLYAVVGLTDSWLFNRGLPPYLIAVVVLASGTGLFRRPGSTTGSGASFRGSGYPDISRLRGGNPRAER
ncbi:MAG: O-antigen ligase family protein [Candidatus Thiosymbion ectosymbiont of Robbea hypermnestra]|nr:O-antigen ligase family protein [Candidatus Thiosymbion ectosymbiont of Robbea hypermnestra]